MCPICQPLDNLEIKIDDEFASLGRSVQAPPIHPRGRCFLQAIETDVWVIGGKRVWFGDQLGAVPSDVDEVRLFPVNLGPKESKRWSPVVRRALGKIPNEDLKSVGDIFIHGKASSRGIGGSTKNPPRGQKTDIHIFLVDKKGTTRSIQDTEGAIAHEVGHHVLSKWRNAGANDILRQLDEEALKFVDLPLKQRNERIFAQTFHGSPADEFVAEAYSLFRIQPQTLKQDHPSLFKVFDDNLR